MTLVRLEEALASFRQIVELQPELLGAQVGLGATLIDLGRLDEAVALLSETAVRWPESDQAHTELGRALQLAKRPIEAAEHYCRAVTLNPKQCVALSNLGVLADEAGNVEQAIRYFEAAVHVKPGYLHGLVNLSRLLMRVKRHEKAAFHLKRIVELAPDYPDGWNSLGLAEHEQQHFEEAERCYLRALAIDHRHATVLTNLGYLRFDQERYTEAKSLFRQATEIEPGCIDAWNGVRAVLVHEGDEEGALAALERLLALKPDHPHGRFHLARVLLSHGSFADGFREFHWRPSRQVAAFATPAGYSLAEALPSDLGGMRLLVVQDQGIGDELFFLRFASRLKARGAWVRYLATPKIASILSRCQELDEVVTETVPDPSIDFAVSVGDLPYLLGFADAADVPASLSLTVLADKLEAIRALLAGFGPPPYYAVTWRAGRDKSRYIGTLVRSLSKNLPMEVTADYLPKEGTVLSVQRRPHKGETERLSALLGRPVCDLSVLNEDLESMLAILAMVDDYYTVSNANVHLLAGLGGTAKVFVPFPPDWRWLAVGEESPWFPGFRIIRQLADGRWPAHCP